MLNPGRRDFEGLYAVLGLVASPLLDTAAKLTDRPLIHVTDATPGFLCEFYGREGPTGAAARDARVLAQSTAVYSSAVMAERAAAEFGASAAGARSLPFGLNFTDPPLRRRPYTRTHLFVLPTRADCTPIVVATNIGGIGEMIGQGGGSTLPPTG